MSYMLDTNIFNRLLDGSVGPHDFPSDGEFFATYIQIDEINATRNPERRAKLNLKFKEIKTRKVPTETFLADISRVDFDKLGSGALFDRLKDSLDKRNNSKKNNIQDALISEASIH